MKTPTAAQIKHAVESHKSESYFFSRNNMKFAGDTMRNFGTYTHSDGTIRLYRKHAVKHGLRGEWVYNPTDYSLRKVQP